MKKMSSNEVESVAGGTTYPLQTGSSYEVWFGFDRLAEYQEGQKKLAAREEAERIAAETGEDPTTVYVDLMGY